MIDYINSFEDMCDTIEFIRISDKIIEEIKCIDIYSGEYDIYIDKYCDYRIYKYIKRLLDNNGYADLIGTDIILLLSVIFKGNKNTALIHLILILLYSDTVNCILTFDMVITDVFGYEIIEDESVERIKKYIKDKRIKYYNVYSPDYIQYNHGTRIDI